VDKLAGLQFGPHGGCSHEQHRIGSHREGLQDSQFGTFQLKRDVFVGLYIVAVFDLDSGLVTITLLDAGKPFRPMIVENEDHYAQEVVYNGGTYMLSKEQLGTRYALVAMRSLVDPNNLTDLREVHALQDGIRVSQKSAGSFAVPNWDPVSQKKVREALLVLDPAGHTEFVRQDALPVSSTCGGAQRRMDVPASAGSAFGPPVWAGSRCGEQPITLEQ
jgi:hypothetical protein